MSVKVVRTTAIAGLGVAMSATLLAGGAASAQVSAADTNSDIGESGPEVAGPYWEQPTRSAATRATDPWPGASKVLERLRAYGVNPILEAGYDDPVWQSNANMAGSTTTMQAVMMHDTGTSVPASRLKVTHSLPWILTGVKSSAGKTVRACHFYVDRVGGVHIVYLRRTWHAGAGDSMFGVPADRMNAYSMGIEIESEGGGVQDLTANQISAASKVAAAALDAAGLATDRAINHKDYAGRKQGKVDSAYPISWWRSKIAAVRSGTPIAGGSTPAVVPSVSTNPRHISLAAMRPGTTSAYVYRYQRALRTLAGAKRVKVRSINPHGATGYYGPETKALTRSVLIKLKSRSRSWQRVWANESHTVPTPKLIRRIGMVPIR